jgi:hypothetical protein
VSIVLACDVELCDGLHSLPVRDAKPLIYFGTLAQPTLLTASNSAESTKSAFSLTSTNPVHHVNPVKADAKLSLCIVE